jgi:hypothetical protein
MNGLTKSATRFLDRRRLSAVALCCGLAALSFLPGQALAKKSPICSTALCTNPDGSQSSPALTIGTTGGLLHPEVVPIFWGSYWNSNPSQHYALVGLVQSVLNGAYTGGLGQYGMGGVQIGPARMVPTAPVQTSPSPTGNNTDVKNMINGLIGAGQVPPPAQYTDLLYVVFIPPGITGAGGGFNFPATCDSTCGAAYNGRSYIAARVSGFSTSFVQNEFSHIFTHELAEAITSNVVITNCKSTVDGSVLNQVSDICNCPVNQENQLGGTYESYWSNADQKCVIPEGWSNVSALNGAPFTWSTIYNGTVRQVYAGGYGLVATNTSDNIIKYSGSGTTWNQIGLSGAQFAVGNGVGNNTIINITPDASAIWRYTGTGTNWNQIDGPASAVYAGVQLLATDFAGGSYEYTGNGSSWNWSWIAATPKQFAVTGNGGIFALGYDSNVWQFTGTAGNWFQMGSSASELLAGSDVGLALIQLAASKDLYFYQGASSWLRQDGPGTQFAVYSDTGLTGLDPWRTATYRSDNTTITNPHWTQIGPGFGRLIGGGISLFAVGLPVY